MARAEYIASAEQFRGRGVFARVVDFLGEVLLGIGASSRGASASTPWWKQADNESAADAEASARITLGRQARLFEDDGSVSADVDAHPAVGAAAATLDAPSLTLPGVPSAPVATAIPASGATGVGYIQLLPRTEVSVRSKDRRTARVVATTRARARTVATAAEAAAAQAATAAAAIPAKGSLLLSLSRSNSLSRGTEEVRWYSVPRRTLLPRYRLFTGCDAVHQDRRTGVMTVEPRDMHVLHGRVWFG